MQCEGSAAQKVMVMKDEKSFECNAEIGFNAKLDASGKKNSLDVVSFTFTSPIKNSKSGSNSRGFNITGGEALSVILEQKLKELTSSVESSQQYQTEASSFFSFANNFGNMGSAAKLAKSLPTNEDTCKGEQKFQNDTYYPSVGKFWLTAEKENQWLEDVEEHKNSNITSQIYLSLPGASPVSSQPSSCSGTARDSFETDRISSNDDSLQCSSMESRERVNKSSIWKSDPADGDVEISDTASSLSAEPISETVTSSLSTMELKDVSSWELQYIVDILGKAELMFEDFSLRPAHKITAPLLYQLGNQKMGSNNVTDERFMLEQRVLFDCVSECLEVKCRLLTAGSYREWAMQTTILQQRQWLGEELYREISNLRNIKELIVDEVVDRDMSSKNGKWVGFEVEVFEEGLEIEKRILTSLVHELIDDFLF